MDIRIGNDIRIDATLKNLGLSSIKDILNVECILINTPFNKQDGNQNEPCEEHYIDATTLVVNECQHDTHHHCADEHYVDRDTFVIDDVHECDHKVHSHPHHNHGAYSIHNCNPTYNVYPRTDISRFFFHVPKHHSSFFDHCGFDFPPFGKRPSEVKKEYIHADTYLSKEDSTVYMYFPGNRQKCGKYELLLKITVHSDDWKGSNTHTCVFNYGKVFKIVRDEFGQCGTIIVELPPYKNFESNIKVSNSFSRNMTPEIPSYFYGVAAPVDVIGDNATIGSVKAISKERGESITKPFEISGSSQIFYVLHDSETYAHVSISQDGLPVTPTWYTDSVKFTQNGYTLKYFHVNGNYTVNSINYHSK